MASPAAKPTFQMSIPRTAVRGLAIGRPVRRGVAKKMTPRAALVSQPQAKACRKPAATVSAVNSIVSPKGSSIMNVKLDMTSWRAARVPMPVAVRNHRAPNPKNPLAAASGPDGKRDRLVLGGFSYGRSFLRFPLVIRARGAS
jgi:hypothetical protein